VNRPELLEAESTIVMSLLSSGQEGDAGRLLAIAWNNCSSQAHYRPPASVDCRFLVYIRQVRRGGPDEMQEIGRCLERIAYACPSKRQPMFADSRRSTEDTNS